MSIVINYNEPESPAFIEETGSGALSKTISPGAKWRLVRISLTLDSAPTTSENYTIDIDAGSGAVYDSNLVTVDLSASSTVSRIDTFGEGYDYETDDDLKIAFANTDGNTWGLRVAIEYL